MAEKKRIDMEQLPPNPIPDTFENVVKELVKSVAPKKDRGKDTGHGE